MLASCSTATVAPDNTNTILVEENDTPEQIIAKAVATRPSARQLAAMDDEFIAFACIGPNTFTGREWGTGTEDPKVFDLQTLDTDQWCRVMKDAGMTKVILTVKHHDGFVIYQSRYTDHGIMSSPYKDGKGDIVRELSESCARYGIKLAVYLSPADLWQMEDGNLYGNGKLQGGTLAGLVLGIVDDLVEGLLVHEYPLIDIRAAEILLHHHTPQRLGKGFTALF